VLGVKMAASKLNLEGKAVLVTGSAGFIGSHLAKKIMSGYA